jgi:hypothetical protein
MWPECGLGIELLDRVRSVAELRQSADRGRRDAEQISVARGAHKQTDGSYDQSIFARSQAAVEEAL